MGSHTIEKILRVGKTDSYSLTVNLDWLNGEAILLATPTTDSAYITIESTSVVGNIVYMYLTGVAPKGGVDIHIDYTTATRSDCDYVRIIVKEC